MIRDCFYSLRLIYALYYFLAILLVYYFLLQIALYPFAAVVFFA